MVSLGATPHVVNPAKCREGLVRVLLRNADGQISTGSPMKIKNAVDACQQMDLAERVRGLSLPRAVLPVDSTPTEAKEAMKFLADA